MANKLGKFLLFSAAAGAAAYGAYYYLRKEQVLTPIVESDDTDEPDCGDLDGEPTKARSYINLTFDRAKAEDLAKDAVKKAKETISNSVQKVEEFFNDEPAIVDEIKAQVEDAVEVAEGTLEDIKDPE